MSHLIVTKLILLSFAWLIGWCGYYTYKEAPVNVKTLFTAFAPFLVAFAWFMLFVW